MGVDKRQARAPRRRGSPGVSRQPDQAQIFVTSQQSPRFDTSIDLSSLQTIQQPGIRPAAQDSVQKCSGVHRSKASRRTSPDQNCRSSLFGPSKPPQILKESLTVCWNRRPKNETLVSRRFLILLATETASLAWTCFYWYSAQDCS